MILLGHLTAALAGIDTAPARDDAVISRVANLYLDEEMRYAVSV